MKSALFVILAAAASVACGSSSDNGKGEPPQQESPDETPPTAIEPGVTADADDAVFQTAEYELQPGEEKFLCFATTIDQDLVVQRIEHDARPSLHHIVFSRTTQPEPDGYSECDTLFRLSWVPLYITGAGESSLDLPEGYAHQLPGGSQLVSQLHLLNSTSEPVRDSVKISMALSKAENPKPVSAYVLGSLSVNLPASQPSSLVGECTLKEDVWLLSAFPHMHLLGKELTFDVAKAGGEYERTYERIPYDFDDQHLDAMDLHLQAGDRTRVTCSYENTYDHAITFGESTKNEMCFFVGFAADRERLSGCFDNVPPGVIEATLDPAPN